ncbi:sensor histidine kinase [Runella sp.]|uniref:sensor histidine kinase n=1 Tax=Runella sp. TaxID=1960881 RepID=UPI003D0B6F00
MIATHGYGQTSIVFRKFTAQALGVDYTLNTKQPIKLNFQPSQVSIEFVDRSDSAKADYQCELKVQASIVNTISLGKSNSIHYANLLGGEYTLKVTNGTNGHTATLNFYIEPVFWEQWWFAPLIFLMAMAVIGVVFYFFFLYNTRSQLHFQSLRHELEIKALRAQMNPHFIFNSLNTIDAYILRKRFVEASDCLQKFSKLIRQILENSEYPVISIDKELATLRQYIEMERERFGDTFTYLIEAMPRLLSSNCQIPPLLLQPFVENAILHGLRHLKDRKGILSIKLEVILINGNEALYCRIEDNGIGRKASTELNEKYREYHKSMGMNVTFERIAAHQALYGAQMQTRIEDLSAPHTGTIVYIWLPLIKQ